MIWSIQMCRRRRRVIARASRVAARECWVLGGRRFSEQHRDGCAIHGSRDREECFLRAALLRNLRSVLRQTHHLFLELAEKAFALDDQVVVLGKASDESRV